MVELAVPGTGTTPAEEEITVGVEFLDSGVVILHNIDIARGVHRDALRPVELAVPATRTTPFGDQNTVSVELLDPVVVGIRDIDIA